MRVDSRADPHTLPFPQDSAGRVRRGACGKATPTERPLPRETRAYARLTK